MPETKQISYVKTIVDQIKKENDPNKSISLLADVFIVMDMKIDTMSRAILGNGNPDESILSKLARHDRWLKWIGGGVIFVLTAIGGWIIAGILGAI